MPWTFAHPAAILPLRRFCPWPLNLAALAIGALTPDFGYYIAVDGLAVPAHTLLGSAVVCLPSGWLLLALFYLVRKPVWYLLPQPHRGLLQPLTAIAPPLRAGSLLAASASIVIGAWSHIAWDAFTHRTGWIVARVALLQERVPGFESVNVHVFHVLQHLSTAAGIAVLVIAYHRHARRAGVGSLFTLTRDDLWRHALFATIVLASLAIAIPLSAAEAMTPGGDLALRAFTFELAVKGMSIFMAMSIGAAIAIRLLPRRAIAGATEDAGLNRLP
jgi:hypothetical protein